MYFIWFFVSILKSIFFEILSLILEKNWLFEKFLITKNEIDAAVEVAIVDIMVPNAAPHIIPDINKKNIAIGINITIPKINNKQNKITERRGFAVL